MSAAPSLIDELESAMHAGSSARRAVMLQRVTDLFLQSAQTYSPDQVALFDDVMIRLADQIEKQALVQLSAQLAPVVAAPVKVVERLACDNDIAVSRPVIEQSRVLTDKVLIDIAGSKSQDHLAAIAGRSTVSESVTDALIERADKQVTLKVARNAGARFSRHGLSKVADRAHDDEVLAQAIVDRQDVPAEVFEDLLSKATEVVRQRLQADANPQIRAKIDQTLVAISSKVGAAASDRLAQRNQSAASPAQGTSWLKLRLGELARQERRSDTIATLAALSKLPIEAVQSLLRAEAEDGVLILCKALELSWPDAEPVLAVMTGKAGTAASATDPAAEKYARLSTETAHRVVRFVKACKTVSPSDLRRML